MRLFLHVHAADNLFDAGYFIVILVAVYGVIGIIKAIDAGYFIVILVAVYGVIGIIKAIGEKRFGVGFVFSILSVIFGAAVLFFPKLMLLADGVLIYMAAAWFVLQGIVSVLTAVTLTKATGSKLWIFRLWLPFRSDSFSDSILWKQVLRCFSAR